MVPIIGLTGRSQVGKTTLAVKLVAELKRRGFKVAAIKHSGHRVEPDQPGKDTCLLAEAGAEAVALLSQGRLALFQEMAEDWQPAEVAAKLFPEVDLVLVEGMSAARIPRIGVLRKGAGEDLPTRKGLIAVVSDMESGLDAPHFSFDQVPAVADLLEQYIQRKKPVRDVALFVNGKQVFIKPFVKDFILKPVAGMVSALRGTEGARRIQLIIDRPEGGPDEGENND
jgi:molybdopterin-guanine dinucleotide biosynthesis protein B